MIKKLKNKLFTRCSHPIRNLGLKIVLALRESWNFSNFYSTYLIAPSKLLHNKCHDLNTYASLVKRITKHTQYVFNKGVVTRNPAKSTKRLFHFEGESNSFSFVR